MLLDLISSGNIANAAIIVFSYLIILLIAFPIHECSHALVAKLLGDPTAENQGRITLMPLAHLDPIGTISLLLFGIGWAKSVPINPSRARKVSQKTAMALTAAAGPVSNVIVSLFFMIIGKIIIALCAGDVYVSFGTALYGVTDYVVGYVVLALDMIISINLSLGVFNLLPIPPFDGSRLFFAFLPTKYYFSIMKYEMYLKFIVLALLWTGILSIPLGVITSLIYSGLDFITGFIC